MKRRRSGIILIFALGVFVIVTIAMLITGILSGVLYRLGLLEEPHPMLLVLVLGVVSILISTVLAGLMGRRGLSPIIRITRATQEITRGNYDIRLEENLRATEVREMARNFNLMARQLGSTETFRSDYIANVSHELKTPISAIEGYATLLQDTGLSEAQRQEYLERILTATRRLSSLSGNILQITSLENQDMRPVSKPFALDEQLRQVILLAEPQWSPKGLELDIDLENVSYNGSKNLLAQVWQNIFDNAVKFTPDGGMIQVLLRQTPEQVTVTIADKGIGMSEAVMARVFEKFYQGDKSHTGSGSGLGLALARRIVELHGGHIGVSSREGKGSTFTVTLPVI